MCVPSGSTTATAIASHPDVIAVTVAQSSDCMVLFQSGQVDAVAGDVPVLNGFEGQDPYAEIVGASLSNEPYGLGVNKDNVDLVRFINSVLADMRADGDWAAIYDHWLGHVLFRTPARAGLRARVTDVDPALAATSEALGAFPPAPGSLTAPPGPAAAQQWLADANAVAGDGREGGGPPRRRRRRRDPP